MNSDIEAAAALLRENGWMVLPPVSDGLPEIGIGQIWISPNPRIAPRTVTQFRRGLPNHMRYQAPGKPETWWTSKARFQAWAKKFDARPTS